MSSVYSLVEAAETEVAGSDTQPAAAPGADLQHGRRRVL